jgi:fermentation-respiration switch protein FrsA (DUF1100 family)
VVLLILAAVVSLSLGFYGFVAKRKAPMPDTAAFLKAEAAEAASAAALEAADVAWIDTVPYETVTITSFDGLSLVGYYLAAPGDASGAATVILAHGYTGSAKQMGIFARFFYETLGYNILLPNARGHGASGGTYIGFGWHDRLDYLKWIDWVKARTETAGPARIILYGISMGAATVLMTAGEAGLPPEVKAVIEDCGYTSAEDELRYHARTRYHLTGPLQDGLFRAVNWLAKRRLGYTFVETSSLEQTKKIKIPVLFIHGDADTFVPTEMVYRLYDACTAPRELFLAPGAGHGLACATTTGEYKKRITEFLERL